MFVTISVAHQWCVMWGKRNTATGVQPSILCAFHPWYFLPLKITHTYPFASVGAQFADRLYQLIEDTDSCTMHISMPLHVILILGDEYLKFPFWMWHTRNTTYLTTVVISVWVSEYWCFIVYLMLLLIMLLQLLGCGRLHLCQCANFAVHCPCMCRSGNVCFAHTMLEYEIWDANTASPFSV